MRETINLKGSEIEHRFESREQREPRRPRGKRWLITAVIIILVIAGIWWYVNGTSQWKAVFLSNNQVYFGHFVEIPFAGTITLKNVYYLQFAQGQQLDTQDQSQLKLVRLGNEIHGPTDEMVIPMSQILFWETLRSDSAPRVMNAYIYPSQQEKVISGAGACGMHLLFLALLVFGVNWQKKVEPQANIVDLWSTLQSQTKPAEPPPPPPPQPEVKPEVKPVEAPPVKAAVKPEIAKPDIALREKAEKERRILEEKQKEAKKREEEGKVAAAKQQQAEAQRLAREQEDAQRRVAEQAAAAQAKLINEYKERIRTKIKRFIVLPPNLQGNPESEFDVVLLPGGEVLGAKLKRGSGVIAYDNAVERAILKAQPLPLSPDPALFKDFRELNLKFRPQE